MYPNGGSVAGAGFPTSCAHCEAMLCAGGQGGFPSSDLRVKEKARLPAKAHLKNKHQQKASVQQQGHSCAVRC